MTSGRIALGPAPVDAYVPTFDKAGGPQSFDESGFCARKCTMRPAAQNTDCPSPLLRVCCGDPSRGATEKCDEIPTLHFGPAPARSTTLSRLARGGWAKLHRAGGRPRHGQRPRLSPPRPAPKRQRRAEIRAKVWIRGKSVDGTILTIQARLEDRNALFVQR